MAAEQQGASLPTTVDILRIHVNRTRKRIAQIDVEIESLRNGRSALAKQLEEDEEKIQRYSQQQA